MPQSFGGFKDNFTLIETVCDSCNAFFGTTLEIDLARGSWEGLSRFSHGIKNPQDYKSLGARNKMVFRLKEGQFKGAYANLKYSEEMKQIVVAPLTQIGFFKKSDPNPNFFLLENVPEKESLQAEGYDLDSPRAIIILGDLVQAEEKLREKKIPLSVGTEEVAIDPEIKTALTEISWTGNDKIHRAIVKTAFNYLTYQQGAGFTLLPDFNPIRSYIRYGVKLEYPILMPSNDPVFTDEGVEGKRRSGHIMLSGSNGKLTIAQVAFFNDISYRIILAVHSSPPPEFQTGHFFSLADFTILPLPVVKKKYV